MSVGNVFVVVLNVLQLGAMVAFAAQRRWNDAAYWAGAVVINSAVLWRSL